MFEQLQIGSGFTSSVFTLANGSTHGDETWYTFVFLTTTDTLLYYNFCRGLPPFTEIYVKMSADKYIKNDANLKEETRYEWKKSSIFNLSPLTPLTPSHNPYIVSYVKY